MIVAPTKNLQCIHRYIVDVAPPNSSQGNSWIESFDDQTTATARVNDLVSKQYICRLIDWTTLALLYPSK